MLVISFAIIGILCVAWIQSTCNRTKREFDDSVQPSPPIRSFRSKQPPVHIQMDVTQREDETEIMLEELEQEKMKAKSAKSMTSSENKTSSTKSEEKRQVPKNKSQKENRVVSIEARIINKLKLLQKPSSAKISGESPVEVISK
ncbi:unnamed protein product [Caenorhabditis nigoni]